MGNYCSLLVIHFSLRYIFLTTSKYISVAIIFAFHLHQPLSSSVIASNLPSHLDLCGKLECFIAFERETDTSFVCWLLGVLFCTMLRPKIFQLQTRQGKKCCEVLLLASPCSFFFMPFNTIAFSASVDNHCRHFSHAAKTKSWCLCLCATNLTSVLLRKAFDCHLLKNPSLSQLKTTTQKQARYDLIHLCVVTNAL